jgi:hypothetical protein
MAECIAQCLNLAECPISGDLISIPQNRGGGDPTLPGPNAVWIGLPDG